MSKTEKLSPLENILQKNKFYTHGVGQKEEIMNIQGLISDKQPPTIS
jgi:hypothetical protein